MIHGTELKAAQLENLRARTLMIQEKLDEHKQQLWSEWNEAVFTEFSEAFAKVKNSLIALHLNEEQLDELNHGIDFALRSLSDKLDAMWSKFKNGDNTEEDKA